ncbi:MAG: ribose 5-phosphate isomerase B [Deltaproteobacteria bacterium]|nr:ribose 5-phosphate isomerase B [Deltaproteobacteria bacterium]
MIAIASDHGGYELKEDLKCFLEEAGYKVSDLGTFNDGSVDYPDYGIDLSRRVASGEFDKGILLCGTGIGMSIVANKVHGIRAALVNDVYSAKMSAQHNDANILVIGGRVTGKGLARELVKVWLETAFSGGRHQKRLDKIAELEKC